MIHRRFRRSEASEYLNQVWGLRYKPSTLAKLACLGGGPAFESFGRWPLYTQAELDLWVEGRLSGKRTSTSDPGEGPRGGAHLG
jgi:hypothetical protein